MLLLLCAQGLLIAALEMLEMLPSTWTESHAESNILPNFTARSLSRSVQKLLRHHVAPHDR